MNILWYKIWADLWLYKTRTFLAITSIAIGVFNVGTLFGMFDLLLTKMDQAHQQSSPSDINLILRNNIANSWLSQIEQASGITGVDTMTQINARYKRPDQSIWLSSVIIARPQPVAQKFDKSSLITGQWPLKGQVAIERMSAEEKGLKLGDSLQFETKSGIKRMFISGIVRHPFVKPPRFGGQVHFFIDAANTDQFGIPAGTFRQLLLKTTAPFDAEKTRSVAGNIRQFLMQNKLEVNVALLQDPEKHWGRPFLAGITGVLKIMAIASLVLASVLILNTLSAHITQQTNQIGLMKATGARTSVIAALYLSQAMLMTVIAIAVAVPSGLAAAYLSSCQLLSLFNISCSHFEYSSVAIKYMLLGGLLIPLVAGIGPIWRGSTMVVREAIASYGLGTRFGTSRFDLWLERVVAQFLPTLFAATVGNLFRSKGQAFLTQSVLIIAGVMFMVIMSLIASVELTLNKEMARSRYTVQLGFQADQNKQRVKTLARSVSNTEQTEVWQRLPLQMSINNRFLTHKGSLGAKLIALPAATQRYQPLIEQGRWLDARDAGHPVLVISADTAKKNNIQLGDEVKLFIGSVSVNWKIIGFYRWLVASNYSLEPVYAPLETVTKITGRDDIASMLMLDANIDSLSNESDYLRQIKQVFQNHHISINPYNTLAKLQQRQFVGNQFKPVISTLLGLASMVASVGGIGLSGILIIGVLQRTREIGVLSAIGASSSTIFRLFLLEGLLHSLLAWLLSVPMAYWAAKPIADELGQAMFGIQLDYQFDLWSPVYWLCLIVLMALVASYWPAKKATRISVAKSLGD